jgi:hypothetical protein
LVDADPETGDLYFSAYNNEKFYSIVAEIDQRWGTAAYDVPHVGGDGDFERFGNDLVLFLGTGFAALPNLRNMENFGIIPYPKFDKAQELYNCRVSYYMPPVLPTTIQNLDMVGAVLELTNYLAMKEVTPAYIEGALKGKYARDEESIAMLDLILSNRVVDLGDTLYCSSVRDGFFASMFSGKNQNLVSTAKSQEKILTRSIEKSIQAIKDLQNQ